MQFLFSEHFNDDYNGIYTALDYLYVDDNGIESRYIHFKNINEMFLYFKLKDGLTYGYWYLIDKEE